LADCGYLKEKRYFWIEPHERSGAIPPRPIDITIHLNDNPVKNVYLLLFFLLALPTSMSAQVQPTNISQDFEQLKWSEISLEATPNILTELRALDIDTDHFHLDGDYVHMVLSEVAIDRLVENGISFTLIDKDIQQTFLQLNERASFHESEKVETRSKWESNCASTDKAIR